MVKVLHYLNQFFAGIGGEEKADHEVVFMPRFEPRAVISAMSLATVMMGVPTFYARLLKEPDVVPYLRERVVEAATDIKATADRNSLLEEVAETH